MEFTPPSSSAVRNDTPSPMCTLNSGNKASTGDLNSVRTVGSMPMPTGLAFRGEQTRAAPPSLQQRDKIFLLATACFIALLTVTAALAWILFGERVDESLSVYLPGRVHAIDVPATIALLPVTLSVVVAFLSISPILYLSSYLHAYYLLVQIDKGRIDPIVRPHARLLVEILAGRVASVMRGLKSVCTPGRQTSTVVKAATALSLVLFFYCATLIGMDIALHVLIKSVEIQAPITGTHMANMWGRALITDCTQGSTLRNDTQFQTSLGRHNCPIHLGIFSGEEEATQTAKNLSANSRVVTFDGVTFLVDARVADNSSFTASTFGLTTQCTSVGEQCQLNDDGLTFTCPKLWFAGTFTKPFVLENMAINDDSSTPKGAVSFLVAANLVETKDTFRDLIDDAGAIVSRRNSSLLTVFQCGSEYRRWQYARTPGTIRTLRSDGIDLSLASLLLSPMIPEMIPGYSGFGLDLLTDGMAKASQNASTLAELADSFASVFSRVAMAPVAPLTRKIPVDTDLAPYSLTVVPLELAIVVLVLNTLVALIVLGFGAFAYKSCTKPGVLYYQWELSMVEMMRQYFTQAEELRFLTAQGRQVAVGVAV